ncbi:PadR family transcriptional regulator [Knoellia remsis]|uniref:PadR family transcriptional regulator n=1 Tax=Knoellia remsis TaxID=407159 RepID=A0A2T0UQ71_9MICO|nr:PadR family transcriptional regulator [Knoellia remsis]PRY60079.1 PadR family transcriptional regulator [Knoellia remsis]
MPRSRGTREDRQSQWLKGVLDLAVLAALARERTAYGYTLMAALADRGFDGLKGGTIYPLLGRLEDDGLVESTWGDGDAGPRRKYFWLTDAGRAELAAGREGWRAFAKSMNDALETD